MKLEMSPHIFDKYSNVEFQENPFNMSRDVQRGRTGGQTDMTELKSLLEILRTRLKNQSFV